MAAEVFQVPRQPDGQSYFISKSTSGSLRPSPPSSSNLFLGGSSRSLPSSPRRSAFQPPSPHKERDECVTFSSQRSASSLDSSPHPSTADFSNLSSWRSTPASSGLSLNTNLDLDDDFEFPNYDSSQISDSPKDRYESDEPDTSTTDTTQSDSPLTTPTVLDDTAVRREPSHHVDYLSHDWREEDIWASWRHIVSQRNVYGQRSRLENASWRTWTKSKYRLSTVSPEKLNWLKESDVTWLYGPLKPAASHPITSDTSEPSSNLSKSSSFVNKKPILKKRSVSEVMLQKSLSSSSLVRQAATLAQAQQGSKHGSGHYSYATASLDAPSQPPSRDQVDYFSSRDGSIDAGSTPGESHPEKHIRFDEKVEQCIAVEVKDGDISDDEGDVDGEQSSSSLSESSSDEGLVMMKRSKRRPSGRKDIEKRGKLSRSNSFQARMIEEIEPAQLKYRTDSPDVTQEAQHHVFGADSGWGKSRKLSPSPSQETLRPSRPSRNFLLADDDDEDAETEPAASSSWSFGASNPKSSLGASASPGADTMTTDPFDDYGGIEGMRRTESGMFMPYDDEDELVATGLFGRVSETFNTMRDIGHVLYTAFRS